MPKPEASNPFSVPDRGEPRRPRLVFRRVGALLAALLTVVVPSLATDAVLHAAGVFPPLGQPMGAALFVLATAYRVLYGIAGGYVAARLAPDRPMRHAVGLGLAGMVVGLAGVMSSWNRPDLGPRWYPVALVVTAVPCSWTGGRLGRRAT